MGQVLGDARGRTLRIDAVNQSDPLGREIVGTLLDDDHQKIADYSTTAATFKEIWVNRIPPTSREQQDANRKSLGV